MKTVASLISLQLITALLRAQTACPTPTVSARWSTGSSLYYAWPSSLTPSAYTDLSIPGIGIDGDVNAAFEQWNYANSNENGTETNFTFTNSQAQASVTVYAYQINNPPDGDTKQAAQYTEAVYSGTSIVASQAITLYFGSTCGTVPCWDTGASNFHQFVQKVMAHEIGHGMGLTDQLVGTGNCGGQVAGQSVMNAQCGTNDSASNLPAPMTGLPECDNEALDQRL